MTALFIDAISNGYEPRQCPQTMTVGELVEELERIKSEYGKDMPVYIRHSGYSGFTYGNVHADCLCPED